MRVGLGLGLVAIGLSALPGSQGTGSAPKAKGSAWQTDIATARQLARSSGKPIFAVFR